VPSYIRTYRQADSRASKPSEVLKIPAPAATPKLLINHHPVRCGGCMVRGAQERASASTPTSSLLFPVHCHHQNLSLIVADSTFPTFAQISSLCLSLAETYFHAPLNRDRFVRPDIVANPSTFTRRRLPALWHHPAVSLPLVTASILDFETQFEIINPQHTPLSSLSLNEYKNIRNEFRKPSAKPNIETGRRNPLSLSASPQAFPWDREGTTYSTHRESRSRLVQS
jgi:hypothetical protein